jgi:peptidoglycan hydrolase-like protein with peptidoglycan-binding domain
VAAKHRAGSSSGSRLAVVALAAAATGALAIGAVAVVDGFPGNGSSTTMAAAATESPLRTQPASTPPSPVPSPVPTPVAVPLHVLAAAPDGSTAVSGAQPVVITFDEPVALSGPMPQITPATPGRWSTPTPNTLRFGPDIPFPPDTAVTVVVPSGVSAVNGGVLDEQTTVTYHVADGSVLRLQQLLADLHYLPVTFTPSSAEVDTEAAQGAMAFEPPAGDFSMRFASTPQPLAALWRPGVVNAMTTGAVMAFENVHHLTIDGVAGPAVWSALLQDAVNGTLDPQPYSWAWTTITRPETLHVWSDGQFVFESKANTGISAAPTPKGSWPVFSRFRSQTMKGTNPDGTKYNDPGVPFINYFNGGDAIHGFPRASYGSPQSLGCVELPYAAAAQVWNLIDYGTVVTVSS